MEKMVSTWNSIDPTFNVAIQDGIEEYQEFGGTVRVSHSTT